MDPQRITVSWCLLTFNRLETVKKSVLHNFESAGYPIAELIWCDNASQDGTREWMQKEIAPDVSILNRYNVGADPGYNRCLQLARSEYVVITGCDSLMPDRWLRNFVEHVEAIPSTGIISCYMHCIDKNPGRLRGEAVTVSGKYIQPCVPVGRRFFKRSLLHDVGLMKEDMGLYGWSDVLWGERAEKVCKEKGLLCYLIPGMIAEHLSHEGMVGPFHNNEEYKQWKHSQAYNPDQMNRIKEYQEQGHPFYMP